MLRLQMIEMIGLIWKITQIILFNLIVFSNCVLFLNTIALRATLPCRCNLDLVIIAVPEESISIISMLLVSN